MCYAINIYALDLLNFYDGGVRKIDTAFIWTTRPSEGVSTATTFVDQVKKMFFFQLL